MNQLSHHMIKSLIVAATLGLAAVSSWTVTDLLTELRVPATDLTAAATLRR